MLLFRRSQWPRGLRHELSSLSRTLGSWVRIPLKAWMSVCIYSVFVLSCVHVVALATGWSPSKESYRLCIGSRSWKSGQGPTKGCRAIIMFLFLLRLPVDLSQLVENYFPHIYQCILPIYYNIPGCWLDVPGSRRIVDGWSSLSVIRFLLFEALEFGRATELS
jgi:hypothetical protein